MSIVTKANEIKYALGLEASGALQIAHAAAVTMGMCFEPGTPLPIVLDKLPLAERRLVRRHHQGV